MNIRRAQSQAASKAEQKAALERVLTDVDGNVSKAAEVTGFARSHVNRLLVNYALVEFAHKLRVQVNGHGRGRRPTR